MYTFDSRIRYSETDETGALSLLGVINYMQDCSTFQSEDIGLGVEYLEKKKRAWLLSSWRIVIDRYPVLGERIKIGTWATSSKGIYGYRDFVLMDQEGNYLVKAESVWFFCDTEKMIPVRVMPEDVEAYGEGKALDLGKAPRKIAVPENYEEETPVTIAVHHLSLEIPEMDGNGITISVGLAFSPEHGTTFMELYRHADTALYQVKQGGKNGFSVYEKAN